MWKTVVRRLLILIPQLLFISAAVFFMSQAMPGDALTGVFGEMDVDAQIIEELREEFGLNDPLLQQYGRWVWGIVTEFDFGRTLTQGRRPVTDLIGERMANSVRLAILTLIFQYALAIPLGVIAARRRGTVIDKAIVLYTFAAMAMPTIVLALLMLFTFGFNLSWFPIRGSVDVLLETGSFAYFISRIHHLILPSITAALLGTVFIINILRSEIIDAQNSDYVTTARSKGVPAGRIYSKHILRNSALPIVSMLGFAVAGLFTGSIFIETIFSYPGIGQLFVTSITTRDFPVSNALVLMTAFLIAMGALIGDVLLTVVDPRIRVR
ncbi:MAG: ABC transporter permease [Defluviitaleaceae bacterium]|nr:ABC transporter permease [Defluviitaleaceae bacterium]